MGPILFLIFVNDVVNCSSRDNVINLFADDVLSGVSGSSPSEVKLKLDHNVSLLADWYKRNRLKLHPKKTKFMIVGNSAQLSQIFSPLTMKQGDSDVEVSDFVEYLGLLIEPDLSFDRHVGEVVRKLNYQSSILSNLAKYCSRNILLTYYKAFIQPRIDYGISVWGCTSSKNIAKVQRVQNRIARIICNDFDYRKTRGLDLLKGLKLYNVSQRRDYFLTKIMFESVRGLAPSYLVNAVTMVIDVHGHNTRRQDDVYLPTVKNEIYRNSLLYRGGKLFNELPSHIKLASDIDDFKKKYFDFIHNN